MWREPLTNLTTGSGWLITVRICLFMNKALTSEVCQSCFWLTEIGPQGWTEAPLLRKGLFRETTNYQVSVLDRFHKESGRLSGWASDTHRHGSSWRLSLPWHARLNTMQTELVWCTVCSSSDYGQDPAVKHVGQTLHLFIVPAEYVWLYRNKPSVLNICPFLSIKHVDNTWGQSTQQPEEGPMGLYVVDWVHSLIIKCYINFWIVHL